MSSIARGAFFLAALTSCWTGLRVNAYVGLADMLLLASLGVAFLADSRSVVDAFRRGKHLFVVLGALALCGTIAVLVHGSDHGSSTLILGRVCIALAAPLCACIVFLRETLDRVRTLNLVVWSALSSSFVALSDAYTGTRWAQDFFGIPYPARPTGLSTWPGPLATTTAIASLAAILLLRSSRSPLRRGPAWLLLFTAPFVLVAAGSRAAILASAAAIIFLSAIRFRETAVSLVGPGMLIGAVVLVLVGRDRVYEAIGRTETVSLADAERSTMVADAIETIRNSPIAGGGMDLISAAHNVPLQFLSAGGLLFAAAFFVYVITLWNNMTDDRLDSMNDLGRRYGRASLLLWVVAAAFQTDLTPFVYWVLPSMFVGATCQAKLVPSPEPA